MVHTGPMNLRCCTHLLAFALALPWLPVSASAEGKPASTQSDLYDPKADPAADLQQALKRARKQGKHVLLEVGGNWCKWCHRLERYIETHKDVKAAWQRAFVVVRVSVDEANDNKPFLAAYPRFDGLPYLYVLDATGKLVLPQSTGALEQGESYDHAKVMAFLKRFNTATPRSAAK